MAKINRRPGLAKNFKPQVALKNGKPCSLKRHYRGALRQVVGYLDLLANRDAERFVWPSISDIRKHCKDYTSGELYSVRIVSYCKETLVAQGIISRNRVWRVRNGEMREGFIVRSHGEITTISADQRCVFQGQIAHLIAEAIAEVIADPVAEAIAEVNGENCIGDCRGDCIGEPPQQSGESGGYGVAEKVFPEFSKSFGAPNLLTYKPNTLSAFPTHGKSDEPEADGVGLFGFPTFFDSTEEEKDQKAADAFSGDPQRTAPKEEEEKEEEIPF